MQISFDALEREPERIRELNPAQAADLAGRLGALQGALIRQALCGAGNDHLISFDEAADLLHCEKTWIYRRSKRLPFVVQNGGLKRVSYRKLQEYIQNRANSG